MELLLFASGKVGFGSMSFTNLRLEETSYE
jgi:hypothetical protein